MYRFADDLTRLGPGSRIRLSRREAQDYCAWLTKTHYENFSVVTWLTPRELIPAFQAVYAFCRWSDDLGDELGDRDEARRLLDWWRGELRALFEGAPRHPVMIALEPIVEQFQLPIDPFLDLISAFEQDQTVSTYSTYEQLRDYCRRSADPVGRIILKLGRVDTDENRALSDAICTGLQLANFWQDVARDWAIGRVYLPEEDRSRFGYRDADLHARRFTPAFADLMAFEVERVRKLFEFGRPLPDRMPGALAIDVALFRAGGLAILKRIEAQGYDVWSRRPTLGKAAKFGLFLKVLGRRLGRAHRAPADIDEAPFDAERAVETAAPPRSRMGLDS